LDDNWLNIISALLYDFQSCLWHWFAFASWSLNRKSINKTYPSIGIWTAWNNFYIRPIYIYHSTVIPSNKSVQALIPVWTSFRFDNDWYYGTHVQDFQVSTYYFSCCTLACVLVLGNRAVRVYAKQYILDSNWLNLRFNYVYVICNIHLLGYYNNGNSRLWWYHTQKHIWEDCYNG
jgi:hypothetical protein